MKVTALPIVIDALGTATKRISIGIGGLGNKWTSGDHQNYSIAEIGQKNPGDLRQLPVTQTQMENHHWCKKRSK